jgi:acetylornithine deacetylase/succinyl-diaminopimelate desuccinylase-like protein
MKENRELTVFVPDKHLVGNMLDLAVRLQQIPSPTFHEQSRALAVRDLFQQEGIAEVSLDELGNVLARVPGANVAAPVVVSAHLDTVFSLDTPLQIDRASGRINGPGIGDNATGLAALFGLWWMLREAGISLPGDLWLVGNVGEEGLGDLRGMRHIVDRFADAPLAYLVLEGMAFGQIYHRALASERYRIQVETPGGHSWVDFGKPSAVHEIGRLVHDILEIKVPSSPRTSLNIGRLSGGVSVNTIAPRAELELDLRSEDPLVLETLTSNIIQICEKRRNAHVRVSMASIGSRPGGYLPADHPLVKLAVDTLLDFGVKANLIIGSTDANIPLSRGLPALCVGITTGGGAHTRAEFIRTEPVARGLAQLYHLVRRVYRL